MRILLEDEERKLREQYPPSMFFSDPEIEFSYGTWEKGEYLLAAEEKPRYLIFIFSGKVRMVFYRDDGNAVCLPSEERAVIGDVQFMTDHPATFYTEAVTSIVSGLVDISLYGRNLLHDISFLSNSLKKSAETIEAFMMAEIVPVSAEDRLISYLRHSPRGVTENISMLSQQLRISRRHLQRILSSLTERGILIHTKRGAYTLARL